MCKVTESELNASGKLGVLSTWAWLKFTIDMVAYMCLVFAIFTSVEMFVDCIVLKKCIDSEVSL